MPFSSECIALSSTLFCSFCMELNLNFSLLQVASCIRIVDTENGQPLTLLQSKRLLYVKSIVRMLRLCGSKYLQLMATGDGQISFNAAVNNLLTLINNNVTKGELCGIIVAYKLTRIALDFFLQKLKWTESIWWQNWSDQCNRKANQLLGTT